MIEQGIYRLLGAASPIAALVSTRIYPLVLPQNSVLPALTYQVITGRSAPTWNTPGMRRERMQFDCWGQSYADATALRQAVIFALNRYQGTLPDGTFLDDAQLQQRMDEFEHDLLAYRAMVEFYLWFVQPVS